MVKSAAVFLLLIICKESVPFPVFIWIDYNSWEPSFSWMQHNVHSQNTSYVCFQNDAQGHHGEGCKVNINTSLLILKISFFSSSPSCLLPDSFLWHPVGWMVMQRAWDSRSGSLTFNCCSMTVKLFILSEPHFLHQWAGYSNWQFYIIN